MAVADREMIARPPRPAESARPSVAPRPSTPAARPAPASVQAAPTVAEAAPSRPIRRRDYDAPASPWPLFLYLLLTFLLVNVAFVWAAVRAAGA
jgi:hypothetical protein